tara:strand:+ start:468 stop:989 length:522 start_codon:yes stop_codon:yes gene_type:complete
MSDKHNDQKLITESFRDWANTTKEVEPLSEYFDSDGNLIEEELEAPINEAIFGGVGMLLLGKLFVFLFKALQSKNELAELDSTIQQSKMPTEAKEISAKVVDLLNTVEKNAPAIEKAAALTGAGGNLNPLNWKSNALISLAKSAVEGIAGKEEPEPEPEGDKPRPVVIKKLKE